MRLDWDSGGAGTGEELLTLPKRRVSPLIMMEDLSPPSPEMAAVSCKGKGSWRSGLTDKTEQ